VEPQKALDIKEILSTLKPFSFPYLFFMKQSFY